MKLASLFTGGKDSTYSLFLASKENEISCLINAVSRNQDSYMFHTVGSNIVELQAKALGLPLERFSTKGEKEKELDDLFACLERIKRKYGIEGVVSGALASKYQADRIKSLLDRLGLVSVNPLWNSDVYSYLKAFIGDGFKAIIISVSADGMDSGWLGEEINTENLDKLKELSERYGFHLGFEGGEAESCVIDGPIFKQRISIDSYKKINDGGKHYLLIDSATLVNK